MVLKYTHVHDPHIDRAVRTLGRRVPSPQEGKISDPVTQKLHTGPKLRYRAEGPARLLSGGISTTCAVEARAGIEPTYGDLQSPA